MIVPLVLLAISALVAVFFFKIISQNKESNINALSSEKQKAQSKYEYLIKRRSELKSELTTKEKKLTSLKNNQEGFNTLTTNDLKISEESETEKISRFLISAGKITMEQNEKAIKKMDILKMDYLATCMALGYIDLETTKKVMKANTSSGTKKLKL